MSLQLLEDISIPWFMSQLLPLQRQEARDSGLEVIITTSSLTLTLTLFRF